MANEIPDYNGRSLMANLLLGMPLRGVLKFFISFEAFFVVFLFAGVFKENPRLSWIPFDLTAFGLLLSLMAGFLFFFRTRWMISRPVARLLVVAASFFLWALISLAWSEAWDYGVRKALQMLVMGFWSFTGAALIVGRSDRRLSKFSGLVVLLSFWMAAELVGLIVSGTILEEWEFASNYLGFGRLLGLSVIIIVSRLLWGNFGVLSNVLLGILTAFLMSILMISGGRGPFLATLAVFVVPAVRDVQFLKDKVAVNRKLIIIGGLLVLILAGFFFIGNRFFGYTTVDRIQMLFAAGIGNSANIRMWLFGEAWNHFLQSPLFGHGIGNFGFIIGWGDVRAYPHNIFLEILVELGVVGCALFIWLVGSSLKNLTFARLRTDPWAPIVLMLFLNAAANSLVSGDMPDNRMFFALLGLCAGRFTLPRFG